MNGATTLRRLSRPISVLVLVGGLEVLVDALERSGWEGVSKLRHGAAALILSTAAATAVAAIGTLAVGLERWLSARVASRAHQAARHVLPALAALFGLAASSAIAFWLFSGERMRGSRLASVGPVIVMLAAAAASAGVAHLARRMWPRVSNASALGALVGAGALLAASGVAVWLDLTLYVSLYSRLHTLLELAALLGAAAAFALGLGVLSSRWAGLEGLLARFSVGAILVTVVFVLVPGTRRWTEESLRHAWREPVYVGRLLSRLQIVEGFVRDPRGWRGATMSSVVRLRERYDIATTTRSPIWDEKRPAPPWLAKRLSEIRGTEKRNVIVFYVDTLRADTARDPRVMPNTVKFAEQSLSFTRAYTTGSDTVHALPGIVGGSYDLFSRHPNDLLHVASAEGRKTVLFVARSAHEFLSKLLPDFRFRQTVEISDYAPGNENVWGYGADQPTAPSIVDRSLDWMRQHRSEPFLLWLFNFDLHNWRELDDAYVRQAGKQWGLLDESDPVWKYRVVARLVDAELGRFLEGLRDLDAERDTVVLFVSDHGEGLGREGFWVHSVFLWESLVRVPLIVRVPGVAPRQVDDIVSLVDVAPTVAGFVHPEAPPDPSYHGEDLLTHLVADHPPRRLPLLLMGTLKEVPVRLGIIEPRSPWKLVLPLEGAVPEMYDLRDADPDARDVSLSHPDDLLRLLNDLVRTPLFPRLSEVGGGGALDQAAADGKIAIEHDAKEAAERAAAEAEALEAASAAAPNGPTPRADASAPPGTERHESPDSGREAFGPPRSP